MKEAQSATFTPILTEIQNKKPWLDFLTSIFSSFLGSVLFAVATVLFIAYGIINNQQLIEFLNQILKPEATLGQ